jgi:hypothetical protein
MTERAHKAEIVRLRLPAEQKAGWEEEARLDGVTLSEFVRRSVEEVVAVRRLNRARDREVDQKMASLGRLTPVEIERLRRRGGDWDSWPELDDESGADA